ncbi:MAG: DUF2178 domain-containing protein [Candidatus Bathyarchaeota archaeon]|nr:DUF2178 domain-containing protein [Candidatus Bathyarchaeota archaeon]MCW4040498.1 DUF2178 domain-containing protein [Candidatus Bathyarchaeota archaeon]
MTLRKNRIFSVIVVITMGASVAIGMITGYLTLAVLFSIGGLGALILYRRTSAIEKPIHDERDLLIDAKSSTAALRLVLGGSAFLGSVLIFLNYIGYVPYEQAGFTLLILANVGALIHQGYLEHYKRVYGE